MDKRLQFGILCDARDKVVTLQKFNPNSCISIYGNARSFLAYFSLLTNDIRDTSDQMVFRYHGVQEFHPDGQIFAISVKRAGATFLWPSSINDRFLHCLGNYFTPVKEPR